MFKGQTEKVRHLLSVNRQRTPLSTPLQHMVCFNIVPYGTISGKQGILPIDLIVRRITSYRRVVLLVNEPERLCNHSHT